MATWATLIDWFTGARTEAARESDEILEDYCSRPLPNEQLYLWVRPIDNSRLKAQAAPEASRACWRSIFASMVAVVALVVVLLPFAYNLLAGYQIRALEIERQKLLDDKALLEKQESELLSPARLAALAEMQKYVDPEPGQLIPLPPAADGAVAMNR